MDVFEQTLSPAAAEKLARRLYASSQAWARTLLICVRRQTCELEERLARETLAFSLRLLAERLKPGSGSGGFLDLIRANCARLRAQRSWWQPHRHRCLESPADGADGSEYSRALRARTRTPGTDFGLTDETFEDFRQATGLSSSVLFGRGENLATLVFYIVAHGCVSGNDPLTRAQTRDLLRAARQCRLETEAFVTDWMNAQPARASETLGTLPAEPRRRQLTEVTA